MPIRTTSPFNTRKQKNIASAKRGRNLLDCNIKLSI